MRWTGVRTLMWMALALREVDPSGTIVDSHELHSVTTTVHNYVVGVWGYEWLSLPISPDFVF
jgi:hypothetical protein